MKIEDAKMRNPFTQSQAKPLISKRVSAFNDSSRSEIVYLGVDQLIPYKNQARKLFSEEELQNLAETIKEHGIRQPLTVLRRDGEPVSFEVVSGERRLRAAKMVGLAKVPCIVIGDHEKAEEIALVENIQRQDLHPIELSRALKKISDQRGWGSQKELTQKLGISKSSISELLKLCEFSEVIQDKLLATNVRGRDIYRKIFTMKDESEKLSFIELLGMSATEQKENTKPHKSLITQSIIRVSLRADGVHIQKNKLNKLSSSEKNLVKKSLLEIVSEL